MISVPHSYSNSIQNISGPTSFCFYEFDNKRLLIIGEIHKMNNLDYENITDEWLKNLIVNNNHVLDIYLESVYTHNFIQTIKRETKIQRIRSMMSDITLDVNQHFKLNSHFIDVRQIIDKNNNKKTLSDLAYLGVNKIILKNIRISDDDFRETIYYKSCYKNDLVSELKYANVVSRIYPGFNIQKYKRYREEFHELVTPLINKLTVGERDIFFDIITDVYIKFKNKTNVYQTLLMVEMDIYFLLNYICGNSINSIVYVGDNHRIIYQEFISKWYKITPKIEIISNSQCITFADNFNFYGNNRTYRINGSTIFNKFMFEIIDLFKWDNDISLIFNENVFQITYKNTLSSKISFFFWFAKRASLNCSGYKLFRVPAIKN